MLVFPEYLETSVEKLHPYKKRLASPAIPEPMVLPFYRKAHIDSTRQKYGGRIARVGSVLATILNDNCTLFQE